MVKVSITAKDALDPYTRVWGVFVDKVPMSDWRNDKAGHVEVHSSGEMMQLDLAMQDGKHKVFFVVSQTGGSSFGQYDGQAQFDGVAYNFGGVDNVNVGAFDIEVKGNKVVQPSAGSPTSGSNSTATKTWNPIPKVKESFKQNKTAYVVGGAIVAAVVTVVVIVKKVGRNRRF